MRPHICTFALKERTLYVTDWCGEGWRYGGAGPYRAMQRSQGFIAGEGRLNYNTEQILETHYTRHAWRGVFIAADLQYIRHPGYNRDRNSVIVPGFRLHVDL